jgi:hypothetical protein
MRNSSSGFTDLMHDRPFSHTRHKKEVKEHIGRASLKQVTFAVHGHYIDGVINI